MSWVTKGLLGCMVSAGVWLRPILRAHTGCTSSYMGLIVAWALREACFRTVGPIWVLEGGWR